MKKGRLADKSALFQPNLLLRTFPRDHDQDQDQDRAGSMKVRDKAS